jgi:hypothetical protein
MPKRTTAIAPAPILNANLALLASPANLLDLIRADQASLIPTRPLNIFYVKADIISKSIDELKKKARATIIGRRDEGQATGSYAQHREFKYTTPEGEISLTVQRRQSWTPDMQKLELMLKTKGLWNSVQTTRLDLEKVSGLAQAGIITQEEMDAVSTSHEPLYALVARLDSKEAAGRGNGGGVTEAKK